LGKSLDPERLANQAALGKVNLIGGNASSTLAVNMVAHLRKVHMKIIEGEDSKDKLLAEIRLVQDQYVKYMMMARQDIESEQ
jgi:hypothetical protein